MEETEVKFTKNKRLIEKGDGSHVGGSLVTKSDDLINGVKLDKRGLSLFE